MATNTTFVTGHTNQWTREASPDLPRSSPYHLADRPLSYPKDFPRNGNFQRSSKTAKPQKTPRGSQENGDYVPSIDVAVQDIMKLLCSVSEKRKMKAAFKEPEDPFHQR
ncbi:uncharacterized protein ACBT57_013831 isoform 2-T2 [Dama dama]